MAENSHMKLILIVYIKDNLYLSLEQEIMLTQHVPVILAKTKTSLGAHTHTHTQKP